MRDGERTVSSSAAAAAPDLAFLVVKKYLLTLESLRHIDRGNGTNYSSREIVRWLTEPGTKTGTKPPNPSTGLKQARGKARTPWKGYLRLGKEDSTLENYLCRFDLP